MATIIGTGYSEGLIGTDSHDIIEGLRGNDYLEGNAGNDMLYGGTGQDSLSGKAGDDTLFGGPGDDYIFGDQGTDSAVFSGNLSDYLISADPYEYARTMLPHIRDLRVGSPDGTDYFNDTVENLVFADQTVRVADLRLKFQVQPGSPVFYGSDISDDVMGSTGDDTFRMTFRGNDVIDGGAGVDRILLFASEYFGLEFDFTGGKGSFGGMTFENMEALTWRTSGPGSTYVKGWEGDDVIEGEENDFYSAAFHDHFVGGGGQDLLRGEAGDDELEGGAGADTLEGGRGADLLDGGDGADQLFGSEGADQIYGGDGNDVINGGPDRGNDVIVGGKGKDIITTGYGYDTIIILPGDSRAGGGARDVITDFQKGTDRIDLTGFGDLDYATQIIKVKVGSGLIVYVDVNQNGIDYSDAAVQLNGIQSITHLDLILV